MKMRMKTSLEARTIGWEGSLNDITQQVAMYSGYSEKGLQIHLLGNRSSKVFRKARPELVSTFVSEQDMVVSIEGLGDNKFKVVRYDGFPNSGTLEGFKTYLADKKPKKI